MNSDNSNSIDSMELEYEPEPTFVLCRRCGYVRIWWVKGEALPREWRTKEIHYCEVGKSFPCIYCDEQIYLDRRVVDDTGRRRPLCYDTGKYHLCSKKKVE